MAGYAVSIRLREADARVGRAGATEHGDALARKGPDDRLVPPASPPVIEQLDLVGRPLDEAIRDWLAGIGESWSQMTFYLFDPQSWR